MSTTPPSPENDPARISRLFREGRSIDLALRRAVRQELLRHKREGRTIAIWRDGKVVQLGPNEIEIDAAAES